jgi:cysteine-rich repeat protein
MINVRGGDGGTVELLSGINNLGGGNISVSDAAVVNSDAFSPGGFGGSIDLDARGDGLTNGHVVMNGTLMSNGGTGTEETSGGDGGSISVTAEGDVTTEDGGALMEVQGGRPDGFGGELEVLTNRGDYLMTGRIVVGPLGFEGGGGDLTIDTGGDFTIEGRIEGSSGSSLLIEADGSLFIEPSGSVDVSEGGELEMAAGTGPTDVLGRMVVRGTLTGNGGTIDLLARDALTLSAPVRADGVRIGGPGGTVQIVVDDGPALLNSPVSVRATGGNQMGGVISVDAQGSVSVVGTLEATGVGSVGGMIGLVSLADSVDISGTINASATGTGRGGLVEVASAIELLLSGTIRVDGGSPNGVGGGTIELNACSVNVRDAGLLSSMRPNGINRIIGRRETTFLGTMRADNQTGLNEFRYRTAQNQPLIFGTVQPDETLVVDATLVGCVECGNGNTEPPEECDDGNQDDGDGCSRSCMTEEILLGDANGDLEVDEADLDAVIAEIFDGDLDDEGNPSDSVADVGSPAGSFSGRPGADANENERIEAADLSAIVDILVE